MADMINNMNMEILKVPLGFIRVVQFPLVILAFATTCGYDVSTGYIAKDANCPVAGTKAIQQTIEFGYSFADLTELKVSFNSCDPNPTTETTDLLVHVNEGSPAKFFVFTGVVSMLFVLFSVAFYLFMWPMYENDDRAPIADFIATALLALFWFAGSCAWASGVGGVKAACSKTQLQSVICAKDAACIGDKCADCPLKGDWGFGGLSISVVLGFLCFFLFASNLWFVYKETPWFRNRQTPPVGGMGGAPPPEGPSGETFPKGPYP